MDDQHLIAKHWENEKSKFDTNFSIIRKQADATAIHDIRVSIKKLRAYLKLYNLLQKETEGNCSLVSTEKLFDVLGKHRDIQICIKLILEDEKENNRSYSELRQYLQLLLARTQTWIAQSVSEYKEEELSETLVVLKNDKILPDEDKLIHRIRDLIIGRLKEVKDHFKQPHKVRKNLKAIYYWIGLLPEDSMGKDFDVKMLHHILDELGEWQDNEIFRARIRHFRKDHLPKSFEEASLIKTLEKSSKTRGEEFCKSALDKTKKLLKKV